MNTIENDHGGVVPAVGAPGSLERLRVQYPRLISTCRCITPEHSTMWNPSDIRATSDLLSPLKFSDAERRRLWRLIDEGRAGGHTSGYFHRFRLSDTIEFYDDYVAAAWRAFFESITGDDLRQLQTPPPTDMLAQWYIGGAWNMVVSIFPEITPPDVPEWVEFRGEQAAATRDEIRRERIRTAPPGAWQPTRSLTIAGLPLPGRCRILAGETTVNGHAYPVNPSGHMVYTEFVPVENRKALYLMTALVARRSDTPHDYLPGLTFHADFSAGDYVEFGKDSEFHARSIFLNAENRVYPDRTPIGKAYDAALAALTGRDSITGERI